MELLGDLSRAPPLPHGHQLLLPEGDDAGLASAEASGSSCDANASATGGSGGHVWLLSDVLDAPTTMALTDVHAKFTPKASQNKHEDGTLGPLRQPHLGDVHAVVAPKLVFAQYKLLATAAAAGDDELPVKDAHFFTPTLGWRSPLDIGEEVLQVPGVFAPLTSGRLLFTDPVGGMLRFCGTSAANFMSDLPEKGERGGLVIYPASGRVMDAIRQHAKIDVAWRRAMAHLERAAARVTAHAEPDAREYDNSQHPPLTLAHLLLIHLTMGKPEAEPLVRLLGEREADMPLPLVLSRLVPLSELAPTAEGPAPACEPTGPAALLSDTPALVLLRPRDVAEGTGSEKHQEGPPGLVLLIDDEEGATEELGDSSGNRKLDKMRERYTALARKMRHVRKVLEPVYSLAVCHLQAARSSDKKGSVLEDSLKKRKNANVAAWLAHAPAARATSLAQRPQRQPPILRHPTTRGTEGSFSSWHKYAWAWTSTAVLDVVFSQLSRRYTEQFIRDNGVRAALTSVLRQVDGSGVAIVAPSEALLAAFSLQRPGNGGTVTVYETSVSAQLVVRRYDGGNTSIVETLRDAEERFLQCTELIERSTGDDPAAEERLQNERVLIQREIVAARAAIADSEGVLFASATALAGVSESPACWCVAAHDFVADRVASSPLVLQELGMQGQQKLLNRLGEVSRAVIAALDAERRAEAQAEGAARARAPIGPLTCLRDELRVAAAEPWFTDAELERPQSSVAAAAAVAAAAVQPGGALARMVEAAAAATTSSALADELATAPLMVPAGGNDARDRMLAATVAVDENRRKRIGAALLASSVGNATPDAPVDAHAGRLNELPLPGCVQLPAETIVRKAPAGAPPRHADGVALTGAIFVDASNAGGSSSSGSSGSNSGDGAASRSDPHDLHTNKTAINPNPNPGDGRDSLRLKLSDDTLGLHAVIADALASRAYQLDEGGGGGGGGGALERTHSDGDSSLPVQRRTKVLPAGPQPALTMIRSALAADSAMSAAVAALPAAAEVIGAAAAAEAAAAAAIPGAPLSALAQATGRVGELLAYLELLEYVKVQKSVNAFFGSAADDGARLPAADLLVEWVNEKDEMGEPYDICLRCRKSGKHVLFIEVKSTRFDAAASAAAVQRFPISMAEVSFAHRNAARYQVWLAMSVKIAFPPSATIIKVDNPVAAVNQGNLGLMLELAGSSELIQRSSGE